MALGLTIRELPVPRAPQFSRSTLWTGSLLKAYFLCVKLIPSQCATVRMHLRCHLHQNRRPCAAAALLFLPRHLQCNSSPVGLPGQAQSAPKLHKVNKQRDFAVSQKPWVNYVREGLHLAGLSFTRWRKSQDRAGWMAAMIRLLHAPDLRVITHVVHECMKCCACTSAEADSAKT